MRASLRDAVLVPLAVSLMATNLAAEPWPPLPPPRPSQTLPASPPEAPPPTTVAPSGASEATISPPPANECLARLKSAGYEIEAATSPVESNQDCRIDDPVKLRTIPVAGREKPLRMPAEPLVACRFAESLGTWLGSLVAPMVLGATGSQLEAVQTGPGFQCRNRNRLPSGKLSAHAEGLALDIASFELANETKISVKPDGQDKHAMTVNAVRRAACGWFTTVLGPGSDPSHADHLHVDLQVHGSSDRYRICQ